MRLIQLIMSLGMVFRARQILLQEINRSAYTCIYILSVPKCQHWSIDGVTQFIPQITPTCLWWLLNQNNHPDQIAPVNSDNLGHLNRAYLNLSASEIRLLLSVGMCSVRNEWSQWVVQVGWSSNRPREVNQSNHRPHCRTGMPLFISASFSTTACRRVKQCDKCIDIGNRWWQGEFPCKMCI